MNIKIHRVFKVFEEGICMQGFRPDITELEQFETREEAETFCKKYKEKQETEPNSIWVGTLHIVPKDIEIFE